MPMQGAGMAPAPQVSVSPVQRAGVFAQDLVQGLPEPQVSASPVQRFGFFSQAQGLPEPLFADLAPLTVPVWVAAWVAA